MFKRLIEQFRTKLETGAIKDLKAEPCNPAVIDYSIEMRKRIFNLLRLGVINTTPYKHSLQAYNDLLDPVNFEAFVSKHPRTSPKYAARVVFLQTLWANRLEFNRLSALLPGAHPPELKDPTLSEHPLALSWLERRDPIYIETLISRVSIALYEHSDKRNLGKHFQVALAIDLWIEALVALREYALYLHLGLDVKDSSTGSKVVLRERVERAVQDVVLAVGTVDGLATETLMGIVE